MGCKGYALHGLVIIKFTHAKNAEIYIAGDFNIDFKNGSCVNNNWKQVIQTHDLHQHIDTPTRVTAHSEKIIDHIYTSNSDHIADISVPTIAMSDHYPIYFTRTTAKSQFKRQNHNSIQYRSFKNFNEDNFLKDLADQMETLDISPSDTNSNFINWTSKFTAVFDKHAPVRHKRVKKRDTARLVKRRYNIT